MAKKGAKPKVTVGLFKKAAIGSGGILAQIAKKCQVERQTVYNFLAKHPELQSELDAAREATVDMAEAALITKVNEKDMGAIKFFLNTMGKKRGYIEAQEVHNTFNPKEVVVTFEKPKENGTKEIQDNN